MMGAVFSNITCRLIVAQMSNTEAPVFNTLLIPLAILVVAIWLPNGKVRARDESETRNLFASVIDTVMSISCASTFQRMEIYYLICYSIYVTLAHIHYGVMIVLQMSDHFNIYTFSREKRPEKMKKASTNSEVPEDDEKIKLQ